MQMKCPLKFQSLNTICIGKIRSERSTMENEIPTHPQAPMYIEKFT